MDRRSYPLDQSPIYRLKSRAKLATLLDVSVSKLEKVANARASAYRFFKKKFPVNKPRSIEEPRAALKHIQRKLSAFLQKIDAPNYLHSGIKGKSYIDNATAHSADARVAKIDLTQFFRRAKSGQVKRCFIERFLCSPDVSAVLTKLTTLDDHLPTGGNTSTIMSFFAYEGMFDEIAKLAEQRGLKMTLCVDDMTFSGNGATDSFLFEVRDVVMRFGLQVHKRKVFEAGEHKDITGVIVTRNGPRLPNRRRKKLDEAEIAYRHEKDPKQKLKLAESLIGRAAEAASIERRFERHRNRLVCEAKALRKNLSESRCRRAK